MNRLETVLENNGSEGGTGRDRRTGWENDKWKKKTRDLKDEKGLLLSSTCYIPRPYSFITSFIFPFEDTETELSGD